MRQSVFQFLAAAAIGALLTFPSAPAFAKTVAECNAEYAASKAAIRASNQTKRDFVAACRAVRYSAIAIVADLYGRHFIRVIRHPVQYWPWLLLFAAITFGLIGGGLLINKRFAPAPTAG